MPISFPRGFPLFPSLVVIAIFAVFGLLLMPAQKIYDGGGFRQTEFRLVFEDMEGKPVEGVELRVENRNGHPFYYYPVSDYVSDLAIRSDRQGLLVFHHVAYHLEEFSLTRTEMFGVVVSGHADAPLYICRFLLHGKEVYRVRYDELSLAVWKQNDVKKITRTWKRPHWLTLERLLEHQGESNTLELFDANGDSHLDREEYTVARYAFEMVHENDRALERGKPGLPLAEEKEFNLLEQTIKISLPRN